MPIRVLCAALASAIVLVAWPSGTATAREASVTVAGVVRDTGGRPVAGAGVSVYPAGGGQDGVSTPSASTGTDDSGRYVLTFPAGTYALSVVERNHHPQTLGARLGFDPLVGYERDFQSDEDIDVTVLSNEFPAVEIVERGAYLECLETSPSLRTVYCEYGYRFGYGRGSDPSELVRQMTVGQEVVDRERMELDSYGRGFVLGGTDLPCGPEGITGAVDQEATVSIRAVPETGPAARHEVAVPVDGRICRQVQISGVAVRSYVAGSLRPRVTVRAVGSQRPGGVLRAFERGRELGHATLRVKKNYGTAVLALRALSPGRHQVRFTYEPSDPAHLDGASRTVRWRLRAP